MAATETPRKKRRWWLLAAGALIACVFALVAALPGLLGTPPGLRCVLRGANRLLAPGSLRFETLKLSWFGPTEVSGFVLRDHQGEPVLEARRATLDRKFWQLLFDRPRYGTLVLHQAELDIERRADGSIDLYETLKPLFRHDPRLDLTLVAEQAHLRFRSAGLAEPVLAERTDFRLVIPPAPRRLTWRIRLASPIDGAKAALGDADTGWETLGIDGSFDRWGRAPQQDLDLSLSGRSWPVSLALDSLTASGRFSGELEAHRAVGRWKLSGSTWIAGLDVAGKLLAGDHLRLARVGGTWSFQQTAEGWSVQQLDVSSAVGSVRLEGQLPAQAGSKARLTGQLDLAALARQLPHALWLREGITLEQGSAQLQLEGQSVKGEQTWQLDARVSDLAARSAERRFVFPEPVHLSALLAVEERSVRVQRLGLKTPFLDLTARGDLECGVQLTGTVDLEGLQRSLHDLIDFGSLELAGQGRLDGSYARSGPQFETKLTAELHKLALGGLGPAPVHSDQVRLDVGVRGRSDEIGLPAATSVAQLDLKTGDLTAQLKAQARDGGFEVAASATAPIALARRAGTAELALEGRWSGGRLFIALLQAGLRPSDEPGKRLFAWSARGRYDRAAGTLELEPAGRSRSEAIALAPDGLRLAGLGQRGRPFQADGGFEGSLAEIAQAFSQWTGKSEPELSGSWSLRVSARQSTEGVHLGTKLDLHDLSWPKADGSRHREPELGVAARGLYATQQDAIELSELVVSSPYAAVEASGRLSDLEGQRLVELKGTFEPNWKRLNEAVAQWVEPQARVKGTPRPFRLKGALASGSKGELLSALEGEAGFDLVEANFFGMRVGQTPIVLRAKDGRLRFDPIRTDLNGGRLALDPELVLDDDGSLVLALAPGASIDDAQINPEVSRRVLAFAAPVLEQATRVRGRVSARVDRAEFPIISSAGRTTQVEGKVVFRDVEFTPGPIADQLFDLIGQDRVPTLPLNQPVTLSIADGRVVQHGLALPIGKLTQVELDGSVDFDRNLDLTASLPITPAMLGNNRALVNILGGTRITVPIGGTLAHPRIDGEAFNTALRDASKQLLGRMATGGAAELMKLFDRLRDPAARRAQPGPSREERRARRLERRMQRQNERAP